MIFGEFLPDRPLAGWLREPGVEPKSSWPLRISGKHNLRSNSGSMASDNALDDTIARLMQADPSSKVR